MYQDIDAAIIPEGLTPFHPQVLYDEHSKYHSATFKVTLVKDTRGFYAFQVDIMTTRWGIRSRDTYDRWVDVMARIYEVKAEIEELIVTPIGTGDDESEMPA